MFVGSETTRESSHEEDNIKIGVRRTVAWDDASQKEEGVDQGIGAYACYKHNGERRHCKGFVLVDWDDDDDDDDTYERC